MEILEGLNEFQSKAVTTVEGPVLVVAGPGTGKTLTIVRRIAYLVEQGIKPEHILAVTFTNRAAREMRERTYTLLGSRVQTIFIGTFHLLGITIMEHVSGHELLLYGRDEQLELIRSLTGLTSKKAFQLVEKISRIKNCIEGYDSTTRELFDLYEKAREDRKAYDLDDLLAMPIQILQDRSDLEAFQFQYIMVDEYQDINPVQHQFIKTLGRKTQHICGVGDADQSIYAFRGSHVENFLNFTDDFPGTKQIFLTHHYRSTENILHASQRLIEHNQKRIGIPLSAVREEGVPITIVSLPDGHTECYAIIEEIEKRIGGTSHYMLMKRNISNHQGEISYRFSDFVVMVRTNRQATEIAESLKRSGIPFQRIGRITYSQNREFINHLQGMLSNLPETIDYSLLMKEMEKKGKIVPEDRELLENLFVTYGNASPREAIHAIIHEFMLRSSGDEFNSNADVVTISTLHAAKGLEFRVVFIAGVEDGLIPFRTSQETVDMEEERRLFYVGMTRAKDELLLLYVRERFLYGNRSIRVPSPFIQEIPEEYVQHIFVPERIKEKKSNQMELFS